ncbi:protein CMSS1 [Pyxicephalus adspersus]|uniref:protein CMSS1 n=1 Tax=Pyxicephalus adspersus TaxID=30357 RepID=UPI003B5AADDF
MADDLGDAWWEEPVGDTPSKEPVDDVKSEESDSEPTAKKSKKVVSDKAPKKKKKQVKECILKEQDEKVEETTTTAKTRKRKKKTITDVLATSEPKAGTPEDLQNLLVEHYNKTRSVIEMEELKLPENSFVKSNDLSHTLSSYLKEMCPKWSKLSKNHKEKKSALILVVCSSAHRTLELLNVHLGIGTPGRIKALIEQEGLSLQSLKYIVLDWNWRDQKLRRMADIPEVQISLLCFYSIFFGIV